MFGPSYLGFVQWAAAVDGPPCLKALAPIITASQIRSVFYPGEAFSLDTVLSWVHVVHHQEAPLPRFLFAILTQRRALAPAFAHVPLNDLDRLAIGRSVSFFQDWLQHNRPDDPYWQAIDYSRGVSAVAAPVYLVAGWYDMFLPGQLADYMALEKAGHEPRLTVGPWTHANPNAARFGLREGLAWFDAHLLGDRSRLSTSPVRVFVMGSKRWLDLADWPPPGTPVRWYLQPSAGLAPTLPDQCAPDSFTYDPAHPTPSVGGIVLGPHAGPRDNRKVELRPDVLTYTSAPLNRNLTVIGPVAVELFVKSSLDNTDFHARLCDVESGGCSVNVCDGLLRLWPGRFLKQPDGSSRIQIDLWPTAYMFRKGHRLRLQVSSGAHPRFSRNLGSGEPLATATSFKSARQSVFHDPARASVLVLPEHTAAAH
jgi:putative CocE/NonD family hydrolase